MTKIFQKFFYEVGPAGVGFSNLDFLDPQNISFHPIGFVFVVQKFLFNSLCSKLWLLIGFCGNLALKTSAGSSGNSTAMLVVAWELNTWNCIFVPTSSSGHEEATITAAIEAAAADRKAPFCGHFIPTLIVRAPKLPHCFENYMEPKCQNKTFPCHHLD